MIKFEYIDIDKFIEKYKTTTPKDAQIKNFKKYYLSYIEERDKQEREGYQKNEINDLLKNTFGYKINEKDNIDSAIYDDNIVKVIIEAKQLKNKNEFPKDANNPLSKAFYESILYFLREYNQNNNNEIKHIIICNPIDFFVFCADEFKVFIEDKTIKRYYNNCDNKEGVDKSTSKFYKDLESHLKNNFDKTIKYTHFKLTKDIDDLLLSRIYQILSPEILLKKNKIIDANTLHKKFYDELLYILGLQEIKENGKILIKLSNTKNSLSNSIKNAFPNISDEEVFSLIILWNNRILFLRLLESMLISFGHIKEPFLDIEKINNFSTLSRLFFGVLAKKENDRNIDDKKLFHYIPYLNSSLFDKTKLELNGNDIKHLESYTIPLYQKSVLEGKELPLLEYIFRFLHTYDFTTTPKDIKDNIKINHDKLINSSILGLVFEKLNGYKEGSFYTPSFITSYMCKESITQAVLNKFNDTYNWNARGLKDISNLARENNKSQKELLQTLLSLKICDPSVGSGHFLVSALNEIVLIAYKIGLLESFNLKTTLRLENDEIVIKQDEDIFNYQKPNNKDEIQHKIQKELFHLKKEIIESCLFGVDINPNSCEITKLRLWIELLKYSYYIFENDNNTNTLQTLPNIDINIKCGNSLISYFDITQSLSHYKNIKQKIEDYKTSVSNYKQGFYTSKNAIDKEIKNLKDAFKNFCFRDKFEKEIKAFEKECDIYSQKYGNYLAKDDKNLALYIKASLSIFDDDFDKKQAQIDFATLQESYNALFNLESNKPFEWRFAFPEVLDNNGNFKGFDLVIGNPPYIRQEEIKHLKPHLQKAFSIYKGTSDIYTYFFEQGYKILKPKALLSFITSNKYTRAGYGEPLRAFILANTQILHYIDLNGLKIFDSATVDTSIITFAKTPPSLESSFDYLAPTQPSLDTDELHAQPIHQSSLSKDSFIFQDQANQALKAKIESLGTPLKEWDISINYGIKTGYNEAFIIDSAKREEILNNCKDKSEKTRTSKLIKKMLRGRDIKRYGYEWAGLWLICTFPSLKLDIDDYPALKTYLESFRPRIDQSGEKGCRKKTSNKWFETQDNIAYHEEFEKEKIVWNRISSELCFCYDTNKIFILDSMFSITSHLTSTLKYIIAVLNSAISKKWIKDNAATLGDGIYGAKIYIEKLPIPKIDSTNKALSDEIISLVKQILESKAKDPTKDTKELESHIDSLVYKLYHLTDEEIKIIEGE